MVGLRVLDLVVGRRAPVRRLQLDHFHSGVLIFGLLGVNPKVLFFGLEEASPLDVIPAKPQRNVQQQRAAHGHDNGDDEGPVELDVFGTHVGNDFQVSHELELVVQEFGFEVFG